MNVIEKQKERQTAKRANDEYLGRNLEIVCFKHKIPLLFI